MCMPSAPEIPKLRQPTALPTPQRLPTLAPPPSPPPMEIPQVQAQPPMKVAPMPEIDLKQTPPPVLTNTSTEEPTLKKRRSKRQELQQASKGTSALRIERSKGIGTKTGGTGSTGLNIPK